MPERRPVVAGSRMSGEGRLAEAKALLARLIAIESVSDASNLPVVDFVEAYLGSLGLKARRAPNAAGDKAAILATIGPRVDGGVVLSGHTDVVPVEGQPWSSPPFTVTRGGRSALWPRRLRHEGLRRLRARDGARVQGREAQAAGSHRAELRRGDHLPRLPRRHRPVWQGRAASGCGDRRRTDDDGGRERAQEHRNLPDAGHRP